MSMRKIYSLVFVRKTTEILLGLKKRGFGEGKWNGFGGKVEAGETILQGAIRELKEECGLSVKDLKKIGLLEFEFEGNEILLEVHVFETYQYHGKVIESEECDTSATLNTTLGNRHFASSLYRLYAPLDAILCIRSIGSI
ncbi:oxidized purine nucleoside triphosphate hydrolase-like isoform X2 [Hylaeus anthracinus]|uniref:oxidized purine nucleoside triphosphate hydrolase-like isoform X2 n=1 Tax=Hylaeus anthracinus TaxID=313031 RepID=UPI0023B88E00|nr:oxidized purine nucleoside triphosphate hydrolase-like isoform X2 [Hylaeus anthracinus]